MAKSLVGLAVAMALAAAFPAPAAAQQADLPPPGREEAMADFLTAELAAQRGETGPAIATLSQLARELRDPHIARRAVEIAIRARAMEPALEMAMLLVELEPDSTLGRDLVASLLAGRGDVEKARETLAGFVDKSAARPLLLSQLAYFFGRYPDKAAVLEATRFITSPYPKLPEAHYALGVAALVAGRVDLAKAESNVALALRPDWAQGAILRAQVLKKDAPADVIPFYRSFVSRHPDSREVRLQLARELASGRRNEEARQEFRAVEPLAPADPQIPYAIGLLSLQLEDWA